MPPKQRRRAVVAAILVAAGAFATAGRNDRTHAEIASGRAEPRKTPSGASERWVAPEIVVVLDASLDAACPGAREAVENAFGTWLSSGVDLPGVTFDTQKARAVPVRPDGENRIYFAPITASGHTGDLALTIAYSDTATGDIEETDIIINTRAKWTSVSKGAPKGAPSGDDKGSEGKSSSSGASTRNQSGAPRTDACNDRYDLQSVVTHEVGHFFGLSEDLTDSDATMFWSTAPCDVRQADLAPQDIEEMTELYASRAPSDSDNAAPRSSAAMKCTAAPFRGNPRDAMLVVLPGLGLVVRGRKRRAPT